MSRSEAWKQQPDGSWLQKYDGMEKFFHAISAPVGEPTMYMIGSYIKFSFSQPEKDVASLLRLAWIELRMRQPSIAATATPEGKLYKPVGSSEIERWLQASFKVHGPDESPGAYYQKFRQVSHMVMHYFPTSSELLLQAYHVLIDGIGVLYLWNAFFSILQEWPRPRDFSSPKVEHKYLSPTVTELLGLPAKSPEPSQKRSIDLITSWAGKSYAKDAAGLPTIDASKPPADHCFRREVKLSHSTTQKVVDACKRNGYSVTSAWQAAVILAMKSHDSIQGLPPKSSTATVTMNLRSHFPDTFDPFGEFAAPYYVGMPFTVDFDQDGSTFEQLARFNSAYFKRTLARDSGNCEMLPAYLDSMSQIVDSEAPGPSAAPVLSSLGLIDRFMKSQYGAWSVDDFWLADTTTTPMALVFLWTFHGRMVLSIAPNATYMTNRTADDFLEQVLDILLQNLGVGRDEE